MKIIIAGIACLLSWLIGSIQPIPAQNCQVSTYGPNGSGTYNACSVK